MANKKNTSDKNLTPDPANDVNLELDFEQALAELENLVNQMEGGELSLDQSLQAFERGVLLTRHCQAALEAAELKVQTLTGDGELVDLETGEVQGGASE
ncbi:MAG: exodeoxyribonuclease VII small subunit [Pseudomonadota bacterium]